ncbi:cytochrome P450 family protein [Candidatus Leptofilum sp.]|uniref:cytochrome P450 family protein n=1 Tax=Candidatus Leptofilum sp. TaxID=3241576 RepID=UPI003B59BBFE
MTTPYEQYNNIHEAYGRIIKQGSTAYVVGYDEARQVMGDHKRFIKDYRNLMSDRERIMTHLMPTTFDLLYDNMLSRDAPDHTRLRALISKAFTNRTIQALAPRIQEIADQLIDAFEGKGETDLIEDFAFPLPIIVICELLGIPTQDHHKFRSWSHAFIGISNEADPSGNSLFEFVEYIGRIIHLRRHDPQDDLISRLVHAEEDGQRLTEQELFSMIALLIVAGHETTVNLIGNGMATLLQHPDQAALLQHNPDLIDNAIEEFLRYEGPVEMTTTRYAAEDVTIGDTFLPRGTTVIVILAAVNRDLQTFAGGDTLDVRREQNKHMGFGYGVHYCVGAPLARLEARIAFNTLLKRLPTLQLAVPAAKLSYNDSAIVRGLTRLLVRW